MVSMQQAVGELLEAACWGSGSTLVPPCWWHRMAAVGRAGRGQEDPSSSGLKTPKGPKQMSVNHEWVASLGCEALYGSLCPDGKLS